MKTKSLVMRILAAMLMAVMVMGMTACGEGGGSGDVHKISWWIPVGEDTAAYAEYEDNPVIEYITQTYDFNGKKIEFDFFTAPPGGEADDFSTLIATGDYCGVMTMSMATSTVKELYEEGIARDLTELVPQYMPNLMAFLEENPDLKQYLYTYIDGEAKIISLRGFRTAAEPNFEGFCYRRDWLVDYGTHPETGEPFTGGYTNPDDRLSWEDNVVFPSGGTDPIYISDWEWMFEIFTKAMQAEGITDGYCYSPYYMGYLGTGDFATGFGGGGPAWYYDGEKIVNGLTTDNFRAYMECMTTWYDKGWINPTFDEQTGDMFYAIDTPSVFQGKVGLWQGRISTVGSQLDVGDEATSGIMVFGCRQPINDIYGGEEQQNKEPNMVWQFTRYDYDAIITDKLSDDEVIAFLQFIDYLYTEEGSELANFGLNKEQYEATQNEYYTEMGLTNGAFEWIESNGKTLAKPYLDTASTAYTATVLNRCPLRLGRPADLDRGYDRYLSAAVANWDYYTNTCAIPFKVESSLSVEQNQQITKIRASLDQFLQRTIPAMIKGEGYDIWDDAQWQEFCEAVVKYRADEITKIYQDILDSFN